MAQNKAKNSEKPSGLAKNVKDLINPNNFTNAINCIVEMYKLIDVYNKEATEQNIEARFHYKKFASLSFEAANFVNGLMYFYYLAHAADKGREVVFNRATDFGFLNQNETVLSKILHSTIEEINEITAPHTPPVTTPEELNDNYNSFTYDDGVVTLVFTF